MKDQITPEQALQILDQATEPSTAGRLQKGDYVNVVAALHVFRQTIIALNELNAASKETDLQTE